ncbi:hypothetical protein GCM10010123_10810 [Pilimelia anulata]|uniref:Zinc transport system substrate-binding protein n=1 Tax=Pilimelia anulata TaxID=53371 RepID=A0A8J3B565_9ACTN|nr:zinc ABC transporter substrate-binding protein [Pilimelia anulata]GGJ83004.1 hypothetical protein GCM10010123_10810 [Pilimelia anulata]
MRSPRTAALVLLIVALVSTGACSSTDAAPAPDRAAAGAPAVVASTSWVGALAKAAGAAEVTLIAPANVQHPPDYDPKPSDLAAVNGARYVLYAEFDGFAAKIREAAGGGAKLEPVKLENTPAAIRAEVTRLGALFGTADRASAWLSTFDSDHASISTALRARIGTPAPPAVAHVFMAYWAEFAGLPVVGTYGPQPVTASQLAALSAKKPKLVLGNGHLAGADPDVPGAASAGIKNFPDTDLDLTAVFRSNAERIAVALGK